MRQVIRLFPSIWDKEDELGAIEITVYRPEEAEELAQYFADHGIKTELVTSTSNVKVMTKTE